MRKLLLLIPLGVVAAVLAVLIVRPWGGGEAESTTTRFSLCNLSIDIPENVVATPVLMNDVPGRAPEEVKDFTGWRVVHLILRDDPTLTSGVKIIGSDAFIDAQTGEVLSARYANAAEQAYLEEVLATRAVNAIDPLTAPWPYSESTTIQPRHRTVAVFRYREADPVSGLMVRDIMADGLRFFSYSLILHNCRSWARLEAVIQIGESGPSSPRLIRDGVVAPEDQAAFDTFFEEVAIEEVTH